MYGRLRNKVSGVCKMIRRRLLRRNFPKRMSWHNNSRQLLLLPHNSQPHRNRIHHFHHPHLQTLEHHPNQIRRLLHKGILNTLRNILLLRRLLAFRPFHRLLNKRFQLQRPVRQLSHPRLLQHNILPDFLNK